MGCPIRRLADHRIFAPTRHFSQLITSFVASVSQGIRHAPLLTFAFSPTPMSSPPKKDGKQKGTTILSADSCFALYSLSCCNMSKISLHLCYKQNRIQQYRRQGETKNPIASSGCGDNDVPQTDIKARPPINRRTPERRCSSRTFRYGYLVTT